MSTQAKSWAEQSWQERCLPVACPACGAEPGHSCVSYRGTRLGEPHGARRRAAGRQFGPAVHVGGAAPKVSR